MAVERAVLLIADIGGYTRFMKVHRVNLSHAQYVVAQLLEAVIDAAEPRFKLAKLEGDAAFFYALANKGDADLTALGEQVAAIRQAHQFEYIDHVSTGGGAMLEYLSENKLPGIEALKK